MADIKNYDPDNGSGGLKKADAEKSFGGGSGIPSATSDMIGAKLGELSDREKRKPRKRLPIIVDVIIAVLMLAIVAGLVVGAYFLFKYYTNEYERLDVEYLLISYVYGDIEEYRIMKNQELYLDVDGNTLYFGKVTDIESLISNNEQGQTVLMISVSANARYRDDIGYSIGEHRLAVGSEYLLRSGSIFIYGMVVELVENNGSGHMSVNSFVNERVSDVIAGEGGK